MTLPVVGRLWRGKVSMKSCFCGGALDAPSARWEPDVVPFTHAAQEEDASLSPSLSQNLQVHTLRKFKLSEVKEATKNFSRTMLLGEGSFAQVYRGMTSDGKSYAFKRIKSLPEEGSHMMTLLEREMRTLVNLSHSNIVQLHGCCITKTDYVFVYELVEGGTLGDLLFTKKSGRRKSLFLKQRIKLALDIATALLYLQSQGVIHRDIKPENIMLTPNLVPKLTDFGLLKLLDPNMAYAHSRAAGTLGYMDPDSVITGRAGFHNDVYSFGILLLSMLTGRPATVTKVADIALAATSRHTTRSGLEAGGRAAGEQYDTEKTEKTLNHASTEPKSKVPCEVCCCEDKGDGSCGLSWRSSGDCSGSGVQNMEHADSEWEQPRPLQEKEEGDLEIKQSGESIAKAGCLKHGDSLALLIQNRQVPGVQASSPIKQVKSMALRRWVLALTREGQTQALVDPSLKPLLSLQANDFSTCMQPQMERLDPSKKVWPGLLASSSGSQTPAQLDESSSRDCSGQEAPCLFLQEVEASVATAFCAALELGLLCSQEDVTLRPQISSVIEALSQILPQVPSFSDPLCPGKLRSFSLAEVTAYTGGFSTSLNSQRPEKLFCGRHVWDGEACIVEVVNSSSPEGSNEETLAETKELMQLHKETMLPLVGIHIAKDGPGMHRVYHVPDNKEGGFQLLEFLLFGSGCNLLEFLGREWVRGKGGVAEVVQGIPRSERADESINVDREIVQGRFSRKPQLFFLFSRLQLRGLLGSGASKSLSEERFTDFANAMRKLKNPSSDKNTSIQLRAGSPLCLPSSGTPKLSLELTWSCSVALQVAQALKQLHDNGFAHGAVGPGTVLVDASGRAFLVGLGHKCQSGLGQGQMEERTKEEGHLVLDFQKDLKDLGMLILQLGTGRHPWVVGAQEDVAAIEHTPAAGDEPSAFIHADECTGFSDRNAPGSSDNAGIPLEDWVSCLLDKGLVRKLQPTMAACASREREQQRRTDFLLLKDGGEMPLPKVTHHCRPHGLLLESFLNLGLQCTRQGGLWFLAIEEVVDRLLAVKRSSSRFDGVFLESSIVSKPILKRQLAKTYSI